MQLLATGNLATRSSSRKRYRHAPYEKTSKTARHMEVGRGLHEGRGVAMAISVVVIQSVLTSLVPRPPLFFVLWFAFSIIHGRRRVAKNGEDLEILMFVID